MKVRKEGRKEGTEVVVRRGMGERHLGDAASTFYQGGEGAEPGQQHDAKARMKCRDLSGMKGRNEEKKERTAVGPPARTMTIKLSTKTDEGALRLK